MTSQVACAFLLAHVSPFKEIAVERGMAEASDMMIQLLEASPVLTLGGPPSLASLPPPVSSAAGAERAVPSPERRRGGPVEEAAATAAGAGGGEGQDSSTVVYQRGKVYAACTVRIGLSWYIGQDRCRSSTFKQQQEPAPHTILPSVQPDDSSS